MVTYLTAGSKLRAVAMALAGMLLGTIGLDPITATPRFTYGSLTLGDGIGLVPMIMGLFGISEVLLNIEKGIKQDVFLTQVRGLWPTRQDWRRSAAPIARGSVLGFLLGILPGIGSIIPTFISYALERRLSRHPEKFGTGMIEGVAGPESANNAATGGAMIPLLTLGIAPNVVMAVLLGAFLIHGVQPGPLMIRERPDMFWGVVASMYVGNVILLVLNLPLIGLWVQLLRVPYGILFPLILLFCVIGVYSEAGNVWDIVVMLDLRRAGLPHEEVRLRGRAARAGVRAGADGRGVDSPVPAHVARQLRHLVDAAARHHLHRRGAGRHGAPRGAPECPGGRPDGGTRDGGVGAGTSGSGRPRCPTDRAMRPPGGRRSRSRGSARSSSARRPTRR